MATPKLRYELVVDDKGTATIKSFTGQLDRAGKKSGVFSGRLGGIATRAAKTAGKLTALGAAGVAAFAGWGITKTIGQFATMETELTKLKNLGVDSLGAIRSQIMALPPELGSATELTAGYYQVLSAGITEAKKSTDTLVTSSKLAKVAHLDQATSVKAVAAGMKAFNTDAVNVADSLMKIEQTGMTNVASLAGYFGEISGMAASVKIRLGETSAALAAVTQVSGTTEKATTQLRAVFQELIDPTAELDRMFADMGGTMRAIEQVGLEGVLRRIAEETGGSVEKMNALVGSQEALRGIIALISDDMKFFNTALDAQKERTGALKTSWETYKGTLKSVWETAKNTVGKIAIEIGADLAPAVKNLVSQTGDWLDKNKDLINLKVSEWLSGISEWVEKIDLSKLDFQTVADSADSFINGAKKLVEWLKKIGESIDWVIEKYKLLGGLVPFIPDISGFKDFAGAAKESVDQVSGYFENDLPAATKAGVDKAATALDTIGDAIDLPPIEVDADTSKAESSLKPIEYKLKELQEVKLIPVEADTSKAESTIKSFVKAVEEAAGGTIDKFGRLTKEADKAAESTSKIGDEAKKAKDEVETPAEANVDTSDAQKAEEDLNNKAKDTRKTVTKIMDVDINIDPAISALEKLKQQHAGVMATLQKDSALAISQASQIGGAWAEYNTRRSAGSAMSSMDAYFSGAEGQLQQNLWARQAAGYDLGKADRDKLSSLGYGGGRRLTDFLSFETGTGLRGLPSTGPYVGHKGEIVLNPAQSAAMRAGMGGGKGGCLTLQEYIEFLAGFGIRPGGYKDKGQFSHLLCDKYKRPSPGSYGDTGQYARGGRGSYDAGRYEHIGGMPSYASGTGISGLPGDGLFKGHRGEIILNPDESEAVRNRAKRGEAAGGNTYNITVAPQMMSGDALAGRAVAKEVKLQMEELESRER